MKLSESYDIKDLAESFNYVPQDVTWDGDVAIFAVNDHRYQATVVPATKAANATYSHFFNPIPKVGNVEFTLLTDNNATQDTVGTVKHGVFKVFSSVAYVATQLMERHQYQVLLCIAKRSSSPTEYQRRVEAYEEITRRIAKRLNKADMIVHDTPNETVYAIYNHDLHNGMKAIRDYLNGTS